MQHMTEILLGVAVLVIGVLAMIHWTLSWGLILVAIGVVQSGLGSWFLSRTRNGHGG